MIELTTPRSLPVHVLEVVSEDPSPRFMSHESEKIRAYYDENGNVIVKTLSQQRPMIRSASCGTKR
jgi:hypothetical protein